MIFLVLVVTGSPFSLYLTSLQLLIPLATMLLLPDSNILLASITWLSPGFAHILLTASRQSVWMVSILTLLLWCTVSHRVLCWDLFSLFSMLLRSKTLSIIIHSVVKVLQMALNFINQPPEGRPGMSDVSPLCGISGLSFDSTLLSPLVLLPSPVTLSILPFSACCSFLLNFF